MRQAGRVQWLKKVLAHKRTGETEATRRGRLAEDAAAQFLRGKGWKVLARNWRRGRAEIDLVCRSGGTLVFVEVRARQVGALVGGYDSIRRNKKDTLRRACLLYRQELRNPPPTWRLDVIEAVLNEQGEVARIRHFENIPLFRKSDR